MAVQEDSWLRPDDLRESWLVLIIGKSEKADEQENQRRLDQEIGYWEVGVANPEKLVETKVASLDSPGIHSQQELLTGLLDELSRYRYQDLLFVTPNQETLQRLRAALLTSDIEQPSLRGLAHVDVESRLQSQFGHSLSDYELAEDEWQRPRVTDDGQKRVVSTGTVERLWSLWSQIYRLIPGRSLEGVAL